MNTNKQLNKGNTMKKIVMMIGIISVLATSANAVTRDNSYMNNMFSTPSYNSPTVYIIW